jgi:hypothetical protein
VVKTSAAVLALALLLAGCSDASEGAGGGASDSTTTSTFPAVVPEPRECDAPIETPIDVAGEPDWRRFADYLPWTDRDGCLVRIDVLAERPGPEHCGWESTRVIVMGDPLGVLYSGTFDSIEFVRDPEGVYDVPAFVEGFRLVDGLPMDAVDTNYRQRERELWLAASDPAAVYIVSPGGAERWPQGEVPVCQ